MVDAQGVVIAIDGAQAMVRMDETGCGRCQEPGGCGGQNIARMFCSQPRTYRVANPGNAVVGDRVSVVLSSDAVRRSAFLAYGMPLLGLFLGAFGGLLAAGDVGSIVGAGIGVVGAWRLLPRLERIGKSAPQSLPYIKN
ncbi:MAG: SoxR reducing system RseC family protein [Propionivibrio sp.]